ncbi:MAG: HNH endonuclease [Hydrococcus sp. RM1_1_31]|nr:HNH endonuclease [Hydrococcus sp. RM1_1_31]
MLSVNQNPEDAIRLTIELVPQTCWFSNVRSEVSKQDWDKLKKITFANAKYQCEICGGRGKKWPVECHEKWHYDDKNKIQKLIGLIALCPACHEVKHMGLANIKGRADIAMQHLAKVNGWSREQTDEYVAQQFHIWEYRSRFQWTLDINWLSQLGIEI